MDVAGAARWTRELGAALEALLLVVDTPVPVGRSPRRTSSRSTGWAAKLQRMAATHVRDSGFELRETGEGWRMYTRGAVRALRRALLLDGRAPS